MHLPKLIKTNIIYGCESRGDGDFKYLTRYTLLEKKSWQLCLHLFHRSDEVDLHDHPWDFWSLILWRGYVEETPTGRKRVWPGMLLRRKAEHVHRVELTSDKPAITLVVMFQRRRQWGFFRDSTWLPFHQYFEKFGC